MPRKVLILSSSLWCYLLYVQTPGTAKKKLLSIGDVRSGYQHDSVSHALSTIVLLDEWRRYGIEVVFLNKAIGQSRKMTSCCKSKASAAEASGGKLKRHAALV